MVMKFHGNVRGEVRVNFLALFASKPHIFMCGALKVVWNCSRERSLEHCHSHAFWVPKLNLRRGVLGKLLVVLKVLAGMPVLPGSELALRVFCRSGTISECAFPDVWFQKS